jgi:hypothetical protein
MSLYESQIIKIRQHKYQEMLLSATFAVIDRIINTKQFDTYSLKKLENLIFNNVIFNGKKPERDAEFLISNVFNYLETYKDEQRFNNVLKVIENIKDSKTSDKFTKEVNKEFDEALENKDLNKIKEILIYLDFSEEQVDILVSQYEEAIGLEDDYIQIENETKENIDFN